MSKHKTETTIIQLAAAMAALGTYSGDNTETEYTQEANQLGGTVLMRYF